ncbi:MAG: cupredoxin domain-containing protein [Candidatus Humimicrobiaceae bacterium]
MSKKWLLIFIIFIISIMVLTGCTASGGSKPKTQVINMYIGEIKAGGTESLESVLPDAEKMLVAEFHTWNPNVIVVFKGDTVQLNITNPRSGNHSLAIPDFNVDTGTIAAKGGTATVEFVAAKAGAFPFKCNTPWNLDKDPRDCDPDHEFMTGTIIVLDR